MNGMEKCVLALHSTDPKPDDISIPNVMRQCLELIARFPSLAVYNYQMTQYFHKGSSMVLRKPKPDKTIAENLLTMMRPDGKYPQHGCWIWRWCFMQNTAAETILLLPCMW